MICAVVRFFQAAYMSANVPRSNALGLNFFQAAYVAAIETDESFVKAFFF